MMTKLLFFPLLLTVLTHDHSFAWNDSITHKDITGYASEISVLNNDSNYLNKLGFSMGLSSNLEANRITKKMFDWLTEGGMLEDDGARWFRHFHDPMKRWSSAGLWNMNQSALLWAQNYSDTQYAISEDWSWQRTRKLYYLALTSMDLAVRNAFFAKALRGVGQQMHLLQDMAVPYHVRNDAHPIDAMLGKTGRQYYFESWVANYKRGMKELRAFAPNPIIPRIAYNESRDSSVDNTQISPIAQLYDTNQLTPESSAPIAMSDNTVGLAEWTNSNFFSDDTINLPGYGLSSGGYIFPNEHSTNLQDYLDQKEFPKTIIAEDGQYDLALWLQKVDATGTSEIEFFAKFGYTHNEYEKLQGNENVHSLTFILDDKCHEGYAEKLIPRAVGYSAALIDYFFRGSLQVSAPDHCVYGIIDGSGDTQEFIKLKAKVGNVTKGEDLGPGTLEAVARYRLRGDYDPLLASGPSSSALVSKGVYYSKSIPIILTDSQIVSLNTSTLTEFTFDFTEWPIPAGVTDLHMNVVFKGTLGNEKDIAVAVGNVNFGDPRHHVYSNSTDLIYLQGAFYSLENPSQGLKDYITQAGFPALPFSMTTEIIFCPDFSKVEIPDVVYDNLGPKQYGRIITISDRSTAYLPLVVNHMSHEVEPPQDKAILYYDIPDMVDQHIYHYRGVNFHAGATYLNYFPAPAEGELDPQLPPGTEDLAPIQAVIVR